MPELEGGVRLLGVVGAQRGRTQLLARNSALLPWVGAARAAESL
jgi:hypothetical protein